MRILLVDIGNTRIKWAGFDGRRLGRQHAAELAGWETGDFASSLRKSLRAVDRIVVSSVAGSEVNLAFAEVAKRAGAPAPEFMASRQKAAGVTVGYADPWRFGVDRFAMTIAGYWIAAGKPVCIVSVGTALTIDLVDATGQHCGGAIVPAPLLMIDSLLNKTSGIRRRALGTSAEPPRASRARGGSSGAAALSSRELARLSGELAKPLGGPARGLGRPATPSRRTCEDRHSVSPDVRRALRPAGLFSQNTLMAIEQGALFAAAAVIDRGVAEARQLVGRAPKVLLTGGGAAPVAPLVRSAYLSVPDLVLQGLAILAFEGRQPAKA